MWSNCPWRGKTGSRMRGILFVAVCGKFSFSLSLVPFLKCYTRWSHAHSSSMSLPWRRLWGQRRENKVLGGWNRVGEPCCGTYGVLELPMSASWLCCKVSPRLCSCSESFPRLLHTFCPPGALRRWSGRLRLDQGFLWENHRDALPPLNVLLDWNHLREYYNYREISCPGSSAITSSPRLPVKTKGWIMKLEGCDANNELITSSVEIHTFDSLINPDMCSIWKQRERTDSLMTSPTHYWTLEPGCEQCDHTCTLENGSMTRMRFCSSRLSYSLARWVLMMGSSLSSALYSVRACAEQNSGLTSSHTEEDLCEIHIKLHRKLDERRQC